MAPAPAGALAAPRSQGTDDDSARITGRFIRWEPVDDEHRYAYFRITNHGPGDGVAECTVKVSSDFGNFGFDCVAGEPF